MASLLVCSLIAPPVDEIPVNYVATHEIDERPVYDHKTGERLSRHLVKVGRQTEHDAMIRHQLFERVPIAMARGNKVRCQWLDEMKEGADGPFLPSRLVTMEVAHGIRFDTFARTAPLKCIKIIISRAASIKNERGRHNRVLALHVIKVACWHAGIHVANEASAVRNETSTASLPRVHERCSRRSRLCKRTRYVTKSITALRWTRWLQSMATTSSQREVESSG